MSLICYNLWNRFVIFTMKIFKLSIFVDNASRVISYGNKYSKTDVIYLSRLLRLSCFLSLFKSCLYVRTFSNSVLVCFLFRSIGFVTLVSVVYLLVVCCVLLRIPSENIVIVLL